MLALALILLLAAIVLFFFGLSIKVLLWVALICLIFAIISFVVNGGGFRRW